MADYEFSVEGIPELKASLDAIEAFAVDNPSLMLQVGSLMQDQVGRTFNAQSDPITGMPWEGTGSLTSSTRPGGGVGGKTLMDTGSLLQSLTAALPVTTPTTASIGTNLIYARINNEGGVITPRNKKYLTVPLTRDARKAASAADLERRKNVNLWVFTAKSGNKFLVSGGGKKKIDFHYILMTAVTIPRRRFLGIGDQYGQEISDLINMQLGNAIDGPSQGTGSV